MALKRTCDWCKTTIHPDMGSKSDRQFVRHMTMRGNEGPVIDRKSDFCTNSCLMAYLVAMEVQPFTKGAGGKA